MDNLTKNVSQAKASLKYHIKFCEKLIKLLNGADEEQIIRATLVAWCLDVYMDKHLGKDLSATIADAMLATQNMETINKDE